MPLKYNIAEQEQQAVITADGSVTMTGLNAFIQQVPADPRFRPHYTVILDLRTANYVADFEDGEKLAAVLKQKRTDFQNKFAVVVPDELYLLAKLYCVMSRMGGFEKIQCFNDLEQAHAWCRSTQ